jgi:hypothetical protein
MLAYKSDIDPTFFVTRFIEGLAREIRAVVMIQRPEDLDTAVSLALLQEEIEDGNPKSAPRQLGQKPFSRQNFSPTFRQQAPPAIDTKSAATNAKISALKAYRKARGECFTCGEKWGPGHKCSTTVKLHVVEELLSMLLTSESEGDGSPETEVFLDAVADTQEVLMSISKQAINGSENSHSMRLMGQIQGHDVLILIDSGSSNNFISSSLAAQLKGVQPLPKPVQVKVAGGGILQGQFEVPNCQWTCQGNSFHTYLKALTLQCYDVILGMQWLEQFGLMQMHWAQKWFQFEWEGKQCRLQGIHPNTKQCDVISEAELQSMASQDSIYYLLGFVA